jgi:hypothetical protein
MLSKYYFNLLKNTNLYGFEKYNINLNLDNAKLHLDIAKLSNVTTKPFYSNKLYLVQLDKDCLTKPTISKQSYHFYKIISHIDIFKLKDLRLEFKDFRITKYYLESAIINNSIAGVEYALLNGLNINDIFNNKSGVVWQKNFLNKTMIELLIENGYKVSPELKHLVIQRERTDIIKLFYDQHLIRDTDFEKYKKNGIYHLPRNI